MPITARHEERESTDYWGAINVGDRFFLPMGDASTSYVKLESDFIAPESEVDALYAGDLIGDLTICRDYSLEELQGFIYWNRRPHPAYYDGSFMSEEQKIAHIEQERRLTAADSSSEGSLSYGLMFVDLPVGKIFSTTREQADRGMTGQFVKTSPSTACAVHKMDSYFRGESVTYEESQVDDFIQARLTSLMVYTKGVAHESYDTVRASFTRRAERSFTQDVRTRKQREEQSMKDLAELALDLIDGINDNELAAQLASTDVETLKYVLNNYKYHHEIPF